jgi:hypothetical protein
MIEIEIGENLANAIQGVAAFVAMALVFWALFRS